MKIGKLKKMSRVMSVMEKFKKMYHLVGNKYDTSQWKAILYDPDRDVIIEELPNTDRYDVFILHKNGKISKIKNRSKLEVMAIRFKLYKKYLVVIQLKEKEILVENIVAEVVKENIEVEEEAPQTV